MHELSQADGLVGVSPWVAEVRAQIMRLAPHARNVLISGPSGTGKELIARAIHAYSHRADKPFIAVDCAVAAGPLFASHLFGYVKGAFSGADNSTLGCFRSADGGTLLLDEIGELDGEMQAKLLRVLQERAVVPLGSHAAIPVDVCVVAATNRDLEQMVAAGRFRQDLYFRINGVTLTTVPLRERLEDLEPLTRHILANLANRIPLAAQELSPGCLSCLRRHDWPGNVRELENFLERALLLTPQILGAPDRAASAELCVCPAACFRPAGGVPGQETQRRCDVPSRYRPPELKPVTSEPWPTLAEQECRHIQRTLERTAHNQQAAADLLGIHRQQLLRKLKKYGLDTSASRRGRPRKGDRV